MWSLLLNCCCLWWLTVVVSCTGMSCSCLILYVNDANSLTFAIYSSNCNTRIPDSCFWSVNLPLFGIITSSASISAPSAQFSRICCLCHAATAALNEEAFPTVPLKSGMTYHFRSDLRSLDSFRHYLKTHYFANNWRPGDCLQCLWFDIIDVMCSTNCYE